MEADKKTTLPSLNSSISSAKVYIRDNWEEGVACPCCTRLVKLYKRKITSSMAYGIILLFKHLAKGGDMRKSIHIEHFFKTTNCPSSIRGDFPKFRYWGIIQEDTDAGAGFYKLTELGERFIIGRVSVPREAHIYSNTVYGFSAMLTDISVALTDKYNFQELMGYEIRSENTERNYLIGQYEIFK